MKNLTEKLKDGFVSLDAVSNAKLIEWSQDANPTDRNTIADYMLYNRSPAVLLHKKG